MQVRTQTCVKKVGCRVYSVINLINNLKKEAQKSSCRFLPQQHLFAAFVEVLNFLKKRQKNRNIYCDSAARLFRQPLLMFHTRLNVFSLFFLQGNKCLHQCKPAHPPNQPHTADLQNRGLVCTHHGALPPHPPLPHPVGSTC